MSYDRLISGILVAQVGILATVLLIRFELVQDALSAGVVAFVVAGVLASALYVRYRARAGSRELERKIERLRRLPMT